MHVIIDSGYASLQEAIQGTKAPPEICNSLALLTVIHESFDGLLHQGQIVVHKNLKQDVEEIFLELLENRFPIEKMIPIVRYGWDDNASMADNNSSAFNFRVIEGTDRLSYHALGTALDINPVQNPFCKIGRHDPASRFYNPEMPGTLYEDSLPVKLFKARGWTWGGNWTTPVDYQHFQKPQ